MLCRQLDDSDRASVFLRDHNGRTGLHHAALLGKSTQLVTTHIHSCVGMPHRVVHHAAVPLAVAGPLGS